MSKTRKEIEKLKRDWRADAIWDLEETEGFEEHREELLAYRREMEAEWDEEERLGKLHTRVRGLQAGGGPILFRFTTSDGEPAYVNLARSAVIVRQPAYASAVLETPVRWEIVFRAINQDGAVSYVVRDPDDMKRLQEILSVLEV